MPGCLPPDMFVGARLRCLEEVVARPVLGYCGASIGPRKLFEGVRTPD